MDNIRASTDPSSTSTDGNSVRLYNDVHFKPGPTCDSWPFFPQLIPELRLRVWELVLQRHRMIELGICIDDLEDSDGGYYTDRNHLGNIISGGNYSLSIKGRGYADAALPSPLLWVNSEARHAAREFYRVQFPFPRQNDQRVLYLNPEYDVLYVRPILEPGPVPGPEPQAVVLVDFLHDVKAYDHKGQGVAHLALHEDYQYDFLERHANYDSAPLEPAVLHPTAASSFASILRRLRSVLCVVGFRDCMRATSDQMLWAHFAQTFPLRRRGSPTSTIDWLESDPRLGVELDLRRVALDDDPRCVARAWEKLEKAFGIERTRAGDDDFSFYICPNLCWPGQPQIGAEVQHPPPPEGSREELAEHLRREAEDWEHIRSFYSTPVLEIQRHGMIDAEMFERMERAPSTAIGMWLFRADAFGEPQDIARFCWNLSDTRPGLLLFEC